MNFYNRKANILVISILITLVAAIIIPLMIMHIQNESKWTLKESRSTTAYHLAEAGQDKAVWYLAQSQTHWMDALSGNPISGYNGDVQYSDISGGLYTIKITSGPLAYQVTVITKGRDTSTNEVRTIKAVYSGAALLSGMIAQGGFDYHPGFTVYWGQVVSFTSINQTGTPAYHPIKVSKGAVTPWDSDPAPPNSDPVKNYTSYSESLTEPPVVDFDYYRAKAKATICPDPSKIGGGSNGGQTATWKETGYFDGTKEVKFKDYTFNCSTCVFFMEQSNVKTDGNGYLRLEAMIVYTGNIHIHAKGANPYTISVPTDAWKQYTSATVSNPYGPGDTAAVDEYPGDCGYHTVCPTYTIPVTKYDGTGNTGMTFHGFLYAYSFDCSGGNNSQVGQILIGPGGTTLNTMVIYFEPTVSTNVHYKKSQFARESWDEIVSTWP